jgi:predicted PurR-regulated permease PerM
MIPSMSRSRSSSAPRFPWPLLVVLGLFLVAYGFSLGRVLGPPLLAFLLVTLLLPYRRIPWVLNTLLAVALAFLLWLISRFAGVLFLLGVSLFLAYLLDPPVDWLQRRRLPRSAGILVLLLPIMTLVVLVLILIVPPLVHQVGQLVGALPDLIAGIQKDLGPFLTRFGAQDLMQRYVDKIPELLNRTGEILTRVVGVTKFAGSVVAALVLVPFLTFYLLRDYDRLRERGQDLIPRKYHGYAAATAAEMDRLLGRWLRGIVIVAAFVGSLTGIGLVVLDVPYALALAVLAGVMNLVPVVGFWVSFVPALIVTFASMGFAGLVKVAVLYFAISLLEGQLLQPRIVGGQVGLHPVVVLLALIVFSTVFGLLGALVAVPLALILAILGRQLRAAYLASDLYEDRETPPEDPA